MKPWVWMQLLRQHYTGSAGSSILSDRFTFWNLRQNSHETIQDWEVKIRQAGSLCEYERMADEINRDKFIFGLLDQTTRTDLLKTHKNADGSKKTLPDVVVEAKAVESAKHANKLIVDTSRPVKERPLDQSQPDEAQEGSRHLSLVWGQTRPTLMEILPSKW